MSGRRPAHITHFSLLTCLTLEKRKEDFTSLRLTRFTGVVICSPPPLPIQLSVEDRCEDWVLLSYQPNPPLPVTHPLCREHDQANKSSWSSCEVRYWTASHPQSVNTVSLMYDYLNTARSILVGSLSPHNNYVFYMACNEHFTSNKVNFQTASTFARKAVSDENIKNSGLGCRGAWDDVEHVEQGQQPGYSTPVMLLREHALTQTSSIDITLGIIFGVFGTVILAAAAFYLWKSHQRRQRILRLFGQDYRDPFQVLDSLEESSIISL